MEWMIGLALIPVLMCLVMMGGMALLAALGLRGRRSTDGDPHRQGRHDHESPMLRDETRR